MPSFVHLHVHSDYSPMEGVSSVDALCQAAKTQGAMTMALTDTNGLYGAIRFLQAARDVGIKPILGADVVLYSLPVPSVISPSRPEPAKTASCPIGRAPSERNAPRVLLAKRPTVMEISAVCFRTGITIVPSI